MEIIAGDVISTKAIKVILPENDIISGGWANFKVTDKKTHFILLLLGIEEDGKGDWKSYEKRLNKLGWVFDPFAADKVLKANENETTTE